MPEQLESGKDVDGLLKVEISSVPKESKSKHDPPWSTTQCVTRNDPQETNGATWKDAGLLGQGVAPAVERMRDTSPEILNQSIPMPPVRSTAELTAISEASTRHHSTNIGTEQTLSTSEGEDASVGSPPPYFLVSTELPGEASTSRWEYLRAHQARLQGQRARLLELQRIDDEEARIREEMDLMRAREDSTSNE